MSFHYYADENQLYLQMKPNVADQLLTLEICLSNIKTWMKQSFLMLIRSLLHLPVRQGSSCTVEELTASAFLTVELDRSLGGNAVQV